MMGRRAMATAERLKMGMKHLIQDLHLSPPSFLGLFATGGPGRGGFVNDMSPYDKKKDMPPPSPQRNERAFTALTNQVQTVKHPLKSERIGSLKEQETMLIYLITLKSKTSRTLDSCQDELDHMHFAKPRYILDPQEKKDQWLGPEDGMAVERSVSELLSFSEEEGQLLNKLEIIEKEAKHLMEGFHRERVQMIHDLQIKKEVERKSSERILSCFEGLREATQYFKLQEYMIMNFNLIKHDSSAKDILEILGAELREKFPFITERILYDCLEEHIQRLHELHLAELLYEFSLFLPACTFLEHVKQPANAELKLLKQMKEYNSKFDELPDFHVSRAILMYKDFLGKKCGRDEAEWRSDYQKMVKSLFDQIRNRHLQLKDTHSKSAYEMVLQTRKEGYQMNIYGDPYTEVSMMEKRFKEIESTKAADKVGKQI